MQRRSFLKKAGLGAVAGTAAVAAPAVAESLPKISWKMTSTYGPSLPALFGTAEMCTQIVEEPTDGNFSIRLDPAGQIVAGLEVVDAVSDGTDQIRQTAPYYNYGTDTSCF